MKKMIAIVGGSGFIGSRISEALIEAGHSVRVIDLVPSRITHERLSFVRANLAENPDASIFEGCSGVINLAGATIGKRWNAAYKKVIRDSRIQTTKGIVQSIGLMRGERPSVLVSASAVGFYGDRGATILREGDAVGDDFLAKLCAEWEGEAEKAKEHGLRVVLVRTANVLGPGGLLASLEPLFKKGLGGYFGSGRQSMPWVHYRDIVGIYLYAIEHPLEGAFNVGAGTTISQRELFVAFAKAIRAPFVWPVPYIAAKLFFGGFADALVASQNTDSSKIRDAGYVYAFSDVGAALGDLYPTR